MSHPSPEARRLTKTQTQKLRQQSKTKQQKQKTALAGSGAYNFKPMLDSLKTQMKPIIKQALIQSGGALGSMTGIPSGRHFGSELGRKISKLVGSGDYAVNAVSVNSLFKPGKPDPTASFGKDQFSIRFQHREFLGDVSTSSVAGAFTNVSYPINAGLRQSFPYLAQMASNFEEYCFKGLVFEFVSTASPYLSTSALGSVIAAMEYNSNLLPYNSKFAMENSALAVSTRIDKNIMYGVECAPGSNAQNCYYTRVGSSTLPVTTTDLGVFQIAVAPGASYPVSSPIGELWVTYDVELSRPYLDLNRNGSFQVNRTTAVNATPLGTATAASASFGALANPTFGSTTISLPSMIVGDVANITIYWYGGTAATWQTPTVAYTTNCASPGSGWLGIGANFASPDNGTATVTRGSFSFLVQCTAPGTVVVTLTATGLPTGATTMAAIGTIMGNTYLGNAAFN